ncbi:hypothetical protein FJY69_07660 [candidate division WOR-3 bacterium]|nr:hypothetical protein [candidate division WOR-3 bacterium]
MSLKEAAATTGYSCWHLTRLCSRILAAGIDQLHAPRPAPKPRKVTSQDIALLKQQYEELGKPPLSQLRCSMRLDYLSYPAVSEEWLPSLLVHASVCSHATAARPSAIAVRHRPTGRNLTCGRQRRC